MTHVHSSAGQSKHPIVRALVAIVALACTLGVARAQPISWVQRASAGPSARYAHMMTYDSARGVTVLFGGFPSNGETWEFNGTAWTQRMVGGPSPRYWSAMAYDSARHVTVLFGGNNGSHLFGDTWEWDGSTWNQRMISGPSARDEVSMVYDSARGVMVLYGGWAGVDPGTNETWEYDGAAWTQRPVSGPSPRYLYSMAYDSARATTVVFGGVAQNAINGETWEYNGAGPGAWTQRAAPGSGPAARYVAAVAYDPAVGATVLFGGNLTSQGGFQSDTWAWDGAAWTQRLTSGPSPRGYAAMVFDSARRTVILFGGHGSSFDANTWELEPLGPPVWSGAYDPAHGFPQSQGWSFVTGGANPDPVIAGGRLDQGPTDPAAAQYWQRSGIQGDFTSSTGVTFELDMRVLSSPYSTQGADWNWQTGYAAYITDSAGRLLSLGIADTGVRLARATISNSSSASSAFIPWNTTSGLNTYRVTAQSGAISLSINGAIVLSGFGVGDPVTGIGTAVFGGWQGTSSTTELGGFRWGTLSVPFVLAGNSDNADFSGTRPDPGASGPPSTITFNSLTIESGSIFSLGSNEILNLNNGAGTLTINAGATFYANGTVLGSIVNSGLLIIPITQSGIIYNTHGGVVQVMTPPVTQPNQSPLVIPNPQDNPPTIQPGTLVELGGAGFVGTNGGAAGGGAPGSSYPGHYQIAAPSVTVGGTAAWDGQLDLTGSFTQTSTGVLRMFIAGTTRGQTYSFLNIGATATINGSLQIVLEPELFRYLPSVGDSFDIVMAAQGLTIAPGGLAVRTLMTADGAAFLGVSLPAFESGFAADPNRLVSLSQNLFSFAVVNGGTTLRITMINPVPCTGVFGPSPTAACPTATAHFSIDLPIPISASFQWQYRGPGAQAPPDWTDLAEGVNLFTGGGSVSVSGATSPSVGVSHTLGPWPLLGPAAGGSLRCVLTSACGQTISAQVALSICATDFNCSGDLNVADIFDFLNAWFAGDSRANFNGEPGLQVGDIFAFLNQWFAGC